MKLKGKNSAFSHQLISNATLIYHSKPVIRISTFTLTSFTTHATV